MMTPGKMQGDKGETSTEIGPKFLNLMTSQMKSVEIKSLQINSLKRLRIINIYINLRTSLEKYR